MTGRIFNAALVIMPLLMGFVETDGEMKREQHSYQAGKVIAGINLTVAEGKRLIAEGLACHPDIMAKMKSGMIIITKGTTNTYVAERLAGMNSPHGSFVIGNITPVSGSRMNPDIPKIPEIVLVDGKQVQMTLAEALSLLKEGDIVFKGANLLNYERRQAAVCIGSPEGGTTAKIRPCVGDGKARFIIPVGLEKEVPGDLSAIEKNLSGDAPRINELPRVWVHCDGEIFTELEAVKIFGEVEVFPYAAGGISGREGGISLVISGYPAEVKKVLEVVERIQGEKPFVE